MSISALDLATLLELPRPTDQQQAIIEAPLAPTLVVAGAGSGKTETMASRVVWLIANRLVSADRVLGLTFTRKAAGSLGDRIARRVLTLRERMPELAETLGTADLEQARVATYNSFASDIFRENALRIGREPESVLLNEASAWQLARGVVVASRDERLVDLGQTVDKVTSAVLDISRQLGENVADPEAVANYARQFVSIAELPFTDGKAKSAPYASVVASVRDLAGLPVIIALAQEYADQKKRRGLLEFSDQVALALAVSEKVPSVVAELRDRYPVVLLDEYQDTSVVQTRLLATLFGGHGVMAVGDPHQSIYGWRGASAANLSRFQADFGLGETVPVYPLSISWRNAAAILDAANVVASPLRSDGERPLDPRPDVPAGTVLVAFPEDVDSEARAVAEWLAAGLAGDGAKRSAAILFRQRRYMSLFAEALRDAGLRFHVLGIGGLLSTPEIVDLVSALRVIHDPSAGSDLIRVLGGARWAIGTKDLQRLSRLAANLHDHDWKQQRLTDELRSRIRNSVASDDGRSIVDALDFLVEAPNSHAWLSDFTEVGLERLRTAGAQLHYLRSRSGLDLLDFVRLVEQELLLDIEVSANGASGLGLANLYAFHDEVEGFLATDDSGSLGSLLAWLDRAARRDDMGPRSENAEDGVVQLLTVHGAKGLEWDLVAVPRLVRDEFPAKSREGTGWVGFARLPFDFRGDAMELPALDWRGCGSQQQFDGRLTAFKADLAIRHQDEERRLGYVAMTRARNELLLTGSFWAEATTPRGPSEFLLELAESRQIPELPEATEFEANPLDHASVTRNWPLDPLGNRRDAVTAAADAVLAAGAAESNAGRYQRDIDVLLRERESVASAVQRVPLPSRVSGSRFKDFVTDPIGMATALRRPMPEKPYPATRLGTRFHSWVESHYGASSPSDFLDSESMEMDVDDSEGDEQAEKLSALIATFEKSPWADRRPVDVEIEIQVPFEGRVLVCKIDAVYVVSPEDDKTVGAGEQGYEIVDWKTGRAPKDAKDLEDKQFQLALYRFAYARWKGIDPSLIDAVFYYVRDDRIIRPERLFDEAELVERWRSSLSTSATDSAT